MNEKLLELSARASTWGEDGDFAQQALLIGIAVVLAGLVLGQMSGIFTTALDNLKEIATKK